MNRVVTSSSGIISGAASYHTYVWWMAMYGLTLLPVWYMIFFLPQSLPDDIVRWIGGGINSLGDSSTISAVQGAVGGQYSRQVKAGESGEFNSGGPKPLNGPSPGGPGPGSPGGSGGGYSQANSQGVTPNYGGMSPGQKAQNAKYSIWRFWYGFR